MGELLLHLSDERLGDLILAGVSLILSREAIGDEAGAVGEEEGAVAAEVAAAEVGSLIIALSRLVVDVEARQDADNGKEILGAGADMLNVAADLGGAGGGREGLSGIGVAAKHHVRNADVIVKANVGGTRELGDGPAALAKDQKRLSGAQSTAEISGENVNDNNGDLGKKAKNHHLTILSGVLEASIRRKVLGKPRLVHNALELPESLSGLEAEHSVGVRGGSVIAAIIHETKNEDGLVHKLPEQRRGKGSVEGTIDNAGGDTLGAIEDGSPSNVGAVRGARALRGRLENVLSLQERQKGRREGVLANLRKELLAGEHDTLSLNLLELSAHRGVSNRNSLSEDIHVAVLDALGDLNSQGANNVGSLLSLLVEIIVARGVGVDAVTTVPTTATATRIIGHV